MLDFKDWAGLKTEGDAALLPQGKRELFGENLPCSSSAMDNFFTDPGCFMTGVKPISLYIKLKRHQFQP